MKLYLQRYLPLYTHYSICQFAIIELDKEYTKEELDLKVKQYAIDQLAEEDRMTNPDRFDNPKDYIYSQDTIDTISIYTEPLVIDKTIFDQLKLDEVYEQMNKVDKEKTINSLS